MVSLLPVLSTFLCVGLALAGHGFLPNQEYHYTWRGRIVGGIAELAPHLAGAGFIADVTLVPKDATHILIQVNEFKHAEIDEEFDHIPTPFDEDLHFNFEGIPVKKHTLVQHPFMVNIENGRVMHIQVHPEDPEWLINMRKAFVNFLHMNLYGEDSQQLKMTEDTPLHYTVMEEGVTGMCETTYSISPIEEYMIDKKHEIHIPNLEHPEEHLVITKTVNYSHCATLPAWMHVSPGVEHCHHGHAQCTNKEARATSTVYIVEGTRHEFVVKHATTFGDYFFKPIGLDHEQNFDIYTVMDVNLDKVEPLSHNIEMPEHPRMVTSKVFHFPEHMHDANSLIESPVRSMFTFMENDIGTPLLNNMYKTLKLALKEEVNEPAVAQSLVFALQHLNLDEMVTLYEKISGHRLSIHNYRTAQNVSPWKQLGMEMSTPMEHEEYDPEVQAKLDVVIDLLAMTGTNPSLVFLSNLISNGHLSEEKVAQVFSTIPLTINTPSPHLIEEFIQLLHTDFVKTHEQALGAGMLALSNVVYDYCVNEHSRMSSFPSNELFHHCHPHHPVVLHEVLPFLAHQTETYTLINHKILSLGNLGIEEILPFLEPYIRGEATHDLMLRKQAIYALSRLSRDHQHHVEEILMPVFRNMMESYEVRQAALTVVLISNPPSSIFQEIATSTWFEHSHQIQNYIYSVFHSIVENNFDTPYYNEMKAKAGMAIHLAKPVYHGTEYSHFNLFSNMINELHEGVLLTVDQVGNQNSLLPSTIFVGLRELFGGMEYNAFEYKFFTEGLINHVQEHFGFKPHNTHGKVHNAVWFKLLNSMERFITYEQILKGFGLDTHNKNDFFVKLNNGIDLNYHKILPGADFKMMMPTELGVPVYINSHFPKYLSVIGKIKGEFKKGNYHVNLDVKPHYEYEFMFNAFVVSPFTENMIGAGVKTFTMVQLPAKIQLESTDLKKGFHLTWSLPDTKTLLFKTKTKPFTFKKHFDYMPFNLKHEEVHVVQHHKEIYEEEHEVGNELFGLDLIAGIHTDRPHFSKGSIWKSFNHHNLLSALSTFYIPTNWHYHKYYLILNPEKSTTHVITTDVNYGLEPITVETNLKLEGDASHTYHAVFHLEKDIFHVTDRNVSLKLSQTHPNSEPHDFEFECFLRYPEVDMTDRQHIYEQDITTRGRSQITYGYTSSTKHHIVWKTKMEQTPDMKKYAQNHLDTKLCETDESHGKKYSAHCLNAIRHATTLNKMSVDLVYEDAELSPCMYNYAYSLEDLMKMYFFNYISTDHTVAHEKGHLTFTAEHCPVAEAWDLEIVHPTEGIVINHAPHLPEFMEKMLTMVVEHPINHMAHHEYFDYNWTPYCMAQGNYLTTFDNHTYSIKDMDSNCWHTVAKHCHDSHDETEVLIKHHDGVTDVKVQLDQHNHVEITPTDDHHVTVTVNNQQHTLPENNYETVKLDVHGKEVVIHGGLIDKSLTTIDFTNLGFIIFHDGEVAWMEVSHMHRNKLCGLCGDFNGEPDDDHYTSHHCIHEDEKEFVNSWIHEEGTCKPHTEYDEKHCYEPHVTTTAEANVHIRGEFYDEHDKCKELKQVVKYYKDQVCISTEKIPICGMECTALYPTILHTSFYCDTPNQEMTKLTEEVHEGHFVDVHDHTLTYLDVTYPHLCVH